MVHIHSKHHHAARRLHSNLRFREVVLIILVGTLGAVAIYTSRDNNTAFGLLNQPVYADFVPVEITFRDDTLLSTSFLELDLPTTIDSATQVRAQLFDVTNPPEVQSFSALNTRVGGEVLLYWELPEGVSAVNIYRLAGEGTTEEQIAKQWSDTVFVDDALSQDTLYTYRITATVTDATTGIAYESQASQTASVLPEDRIPPLSPNEISISSVSVNGKAALRILWTYPSDDDIAAVRIFRSTYFGTRGEQIAQVEYPKAEYFDTTAPANTTVYYTLVAVDEAGNASSADFQSPLPGNASPFTPFGLQTQ